MKQRVGIARALVMERPVLFLDEPFSALDVLTAETLRKEVLNIWHSNKTATSSMVLVTHNIIEAVSLGNRILVMGTHPGRIRVSIQNDLPFPRDERSAEFRALVERIHDVITEAINPNAPEHAPAEIAPDSAAVEALPPISINEVIGLVAFVADHGGRADLFAIAHTLGKDFGHVLFAAKGAELLNLVDTPRNSVVLTELGRRFAAGDVNERKRLVRESLSALRLSRLLQDRLKSAPGHGLVSAKVEAFLHELMPNQNPREQLKLIIQWGRYGELFGYSAARKELYLDLGEEGA